MVETTIPSNETKDLEKSADVDEYNPGSEKEPTLDAETGDANANDGKNGYFGSAENSTKRVMKPRHLAFIAIGGTIGTGIFLSAGSSVATGGAGGALVAYAIVALFVFGVVFLLGEMSSLIPVSGAFSVFGERFVSDALGFTLGWNYAIQWAFSIPAELISAATILSFWTDKLNTWQWSLVIIVPVFLFQLLGARAYGEAEYWLAAIKVVLLLMFIIVGLIYNWGGVIGHPGPGLSYWRDGPFYDGFKGVALCFSYAFFSYGGVEMVALAAGESANPQKSVPAAIKATFFRILIFYILSVFVIGLNVHRTDPTLVSAYSDNNIAASPITVVFVRAGFGAAVHVVNAVLLSAVLSATNSSFFATSRMVLSLAQEKKAPKIFAYCTKRGVPIPALLLSLAASCATFLTSIWGNGIAFTWFINLTGMSALLTWVAIALTNVRFRMCWRAQGRDWSDMPFRAPLPTVLAIIAVVLGGCMFAAQGWAATTYGSDTLATDIVAVYIGCALFILMYAGYTIYELIWVRDENGNRKRHFVPLKQADLVTGAVWGPGGGAIAKQRALEEKEAAKATGNGRFTWSRIRENLY